MEPLSRVTGATVDVLDALLARGSEPVWGLRIIEVINRPAGTIYPILARLEVAGWVRSQWDDDDTERRGPRRRMYWLTDDGAVAAATTSRSFHGRQGAHETRIAWNPS